MVRQYFSAVYKQTRKRTEKRERKRTVVGLPRIFTDSFKNLHFTLMHARYRFKKAHTVYLPWKKWVLSGRGVGNQTRGTKTDWHRIWVQRIEVLHQRPITDDAAESVSGFLKASGALATAWSNTASIFFLTNFQQERFSILTLYKEFQGAGSYWSTIWFKHCRWERVKDVQMGTESGEGSFR